MNLEEGVGEADVVVGAAEDGGGVVVVLTMSAVADDQEMEVGAIVEVVRVLVFVSSLVKSPW